MVPLQSSEDEYVSSPALNSLKSSGLLKVKAQALGSGYYNPEMGPPNKNNVNANLRSSSHGPLPYQHSETDDLNNNKN